MYDRRSMSLKTFLEVHCKPNMPDHGRFSKKLWRRFGPLFGVDFSVCSICGMTDTWNGKPIVMHMDHIDGDPYNNSTDNVRSVCPNCHSQTETYCRPKAC